MPMNPDGKRSSSGETPDEYIAGGEPGVVVRRCSRSNQVTTRPQEECVK
jgi:hypothetical protein